MLPSAVTNARAQWSFTVRVTHCLASVVTLVSGDTKIGGLERLLKVKPYSTLGKTLYHTILMFEDLPVIRGGMQHFMIPSRSFFVTPLYDMMILV